MVDKPLAPISPDDNRLVMRETSFLIELAGLKEAFGRRVDSGVATLERFDKFSPEMRAVDIQSHLAGLSWNPVTKDASYPEPTSKLFPKYAGEGFIGVSAPEKFGGSDMLTSLQSMMAIIGFAGNRQFYLKEMVTTSGVNALVHAHSIEKDPAKKTMLENVIGKIISGEYTGAMILTEPKGGSNLGTEMEMAATVTADGKKATVSGDKNYITGVSTGGIPTVKNAMCLVVGILRGPDGNILYEGKDDNKRPQVTVTLVPKYKMDEKGNTIEPLQENGVEISEPYRKPGIEPQILTAVRFNKSEAWVLGEVGKLQELSNKKDASQGWDVMFAVMNAARLKIGAQGAEAALGSFLHAAYFATWRGADTRNEKPIVYHPQVLDRLKEMRSYAELGASLLVDVGKNLDFAKGAGDMSDSERKKMAALVELQTPMIKGFLTESGKSAAKLCLDVMAAQGYTSIEIPKLLADIDPATFYEGTNQMMARAIATRQALFGVPGTGQMVEDPQGSGKMVEDKKTRQPGMDYFIERTESAIAALGPIEENPQLQKAVQPLLRGINKLREETVWLKEKLVNSNDPAAMRYVLAASEEYMMLFGKVSMGLEAVKSVALVQKKMREEGLSPEDRDFYITKIDTATYFNNVVLENNPRTRGEFLEMTPDLEKMVEWQKARLKRERHEAGEETMTVGKVRRVDRIRQESGAPYSYRTQTAKI